MPTDWHNERQERWDRIMVRILDVLIGLSLVAIVVLVLKMMFFSRAEGCLRSRFCLLPGDGRRRLAGGSEHPGCLLINRSGSMRPWTGWRDAAIECTAIHAMTRTSNWRCGGISVRAAPCPTAPPTRSYSPPLPAA